MLGEHTNIVRDCLASDNGDDVKTDGEVVEGQRRRCREWAVRRRRAATVAVLRAVKERDRCQTRTAT